MFKKVGIWWVFRRHHNRKNGTMVPDVVQKDKFSEIFHTVSYCWNAKCKTSTWSSEAELGRSSIIWYFTGIWTHCCQHSTAM